MAQCIAKSNTTEVKKLPKALVLVTLADSRSFLNSIIIKRVVDDKDGALVTSRSVNGVASARRDRYVWMCVGIQAWNSNVLPIRRCGMKDWRMAMAIRSSV